MNSRLTKEIKVRVDEQGMPRGLFHNGNFWVVRRIVDMWRDTGQWWDGEEEKTFFRVTALPVRDEGPPVLMEIYSDDAGEVWVLYLIYD